MCIRDSFYAAPFDGRMFDTGSKEGFIEANVAFALSRDDMRDRVAGPISDLLMAHGGSARLTRRSA